MQPRRPLLIGVLSLFLMIAAVGPPASAAAPEPVTYLVGFHTVPDDVGRGTYLGEDVRRVHDGIRMAVVDARDPGAFEARAASDPNVRYVEVDVPDAFVVHVTPDDPYYGYQYGWGHVNAPAAWDTTFGAPTTIVAVLDTGIDRDHEDFDAARILEGYNALDGNTDVNDKCGHGTHVSGTVGASTNNGVGVAGAAQTSILPVKVLDKGGPFGSCSGSFSAVAEGITFAADQGADVISMSLGCEGCYSQAVADAIAYAWGKNALLVGSAGNAGPCTDCVGFPANHPDVMAVACTDEEKTQCSFSSEGAEVEIAAPGSAILSTTPKDQYAFASGTSMSAPHVSGAAALVLATNESLTNAELRQALQDTAVDLGTAGVDEKYGHGLLDMNAFMSAVGGTVAEGPTASFTTTCTDLSCTFDASGSTAGDAPIVGYAWDFGDGHTATGEVVSHTFAASGTYDVTLTVTDDAGLTDSATKAVSVSDGSEPTLHVQDITGDWRHYGRGFHRVTWDVLVADAGGAPVADATVSVTITTPAGSVTETAATGSDGVAAFRFDDKDQQHGDYTLCVDDVQKDGWVYDAGANTLTCATLNVSAH